MNETNVVADWNFWFQYPNNGKKKHLSKPKGHASYYFIFNCLTKEILYTSDSYTEILGYNKEEYSFVDILGCIHPEDIDYVKVCERKIIDFISALPENEEFRFTISYSFRICTATGTYIRVKQNYQAVEVNNKGIMTRALVHHEILNDDENRSYNDLQIFDRRTNQFIQIENTFNLTKREFEILALIKKGLTSIEISNKLFLSKLTIDTHRKNILAKTNSRKFITMNP